MGLKKLARKISDYNERLEEGKASRIKPDHVEKVLRKLQQKVESLEEEIRVAPGPEKKARLERKLEIARAHVERAGLLLKEIG